MTLLGYGEYTYEVSGKDWGDLPDGWSYKEATAVAVDSKDNVYVYNRGGHWIIIFDSNGKFLRSWGEKIFTNPHGVTISPDDTIFCVDSADHTIRKFTLDGKLLMTIGVPGKSSAPMSGQPFNKPTHIAVDPRNGDLYVSDGYANASIHKYSPDGRLLFSWGESGTRPGEFNIPHNIAVDRDGWVYVADRENQRVQIFDSNGKFETQWVNLARTCAVYVDNRGDPLVYIGEYYCGDTTNTMGLRIGPRISIMDTSGNLVSELGVKSFGDDPGRFYAPHGISVDSKGNIYVAEVSWGEFGSQMDPPRNLRSMQKLIKQ